MFKKLNKTLINDKKINSYKLSCVLNNEFTRVLNEYGEVLPDANVTFEINDKGEYVINYSAKLNRIKSFGLLN